VAPAGSAGDESEEVVEVPVGSSHDEKEGIDPDGARRHDSRGFINVSLNADMSLKSSAASFFVSLLPLPRLEGGDDAKTLEFSLEGLAVDVGDLTSFVSLEPFCCSL